MVYDVCKRESFDSCCKYWLDTYRVYAQENSIILLIGNQIDRCVNNEGMREVEISEGKEFAEKNNLMFIETSAVLDINVIEAFQMLIEKIYDKN